MMATAEFFRKHEYLTGLNVFDAEKKDHLVAVYERLRSLLPSGQPAERMDGWHVRDKELWDICIHSRILDLVEEILGPVFFFGARNFFAKTQEIARLFLGIRTLFTGHCLHNIPSRSGWPSWMSMRKCRHASFAPNP